MNSGSDQQRGRVWRWLDKADRVMTMGMYPISLLIRWVAAWIVVSLLIDIPQPSFVTEATEHPLFIVGLLAFALFLMAGDAARYHKREVFGNAE